MSGQYDPVYLDLEDPYDDTPEGEWRPPPTPRLDRPYQEVRHSQEYKVLRGQFLFACRTTRMPDGTYGLPCWLCGKPIDYNKHHRSRWAPTVDHVIPVRLRPDLILAVRNWKPAHRTCNEGRERKLDDELANLGEPSEVW